MAHGESNGHVHKIQFQDDDLAEVSALWMLFLV